MAERKLSTKEIGKLKRFVSISKGENMMKYYILPMVDIEVDGFNGSSNIKSAHINKAGTLVYLALKKWPQYLVDRVVENNNFKFICKLKDEDFAVFDVPELMLSDLKRLRDGRYTEFEASTREKICKLSGLPFNMKTRRTSLASTHLYLQALFLDSNIRNVLAIYLGVKLNEIPNEVIAQLSEDSTVYIENFLKQ